MAGSTQKVFLLMLVIMGSLFVAFYHLELSNVLQSGVCKKVYYIYEKDEDMVSSTAATDDADASTPTVQHKPATQVGTEMEVEESFLCPDEPVPDAGPIPISEEAQPFAKLESRFTHLRPGGKWKPFRCKARYRVAILIPYRDRQEHLQILLAHLHPFLRRQNLDYGIFIIEQTQGSTFNRGLLYNAGVKELTSRYPDYYQCVVLHDVDLLPEDDRMVYNCSDPPRHLSGHRNIYNYTLRYTGYWGGVLELKTDLYQRVNGFSNVYFGWGGEDDDFRLRIQDRGIEVQRYPGSWGRYTMADHEAAEPNDLRMDMLKNNLVRASIDGLNSVRYGLVSYQEQPLYTNITVDINERYVIENFHSKVRRLFPWLKAMVRESQEEYPDDPHDPNAVRTEKKTIRRPGKNVKVIHLR